MPVLMIGLSIYDKLPDKEQKEFALVEQYRTDNFYECYEYEKELMKFCDAGNQIKVIGAN